MNTHIVTQASSPFESFPGKPWVALNGKAYPAKVLRVISKFWDEETWNFYLDSLEKPLKEQLFIFGMKDKYISYTDTTDGMISTTPPATLIKVRSCLQKLTSTQRRVIIAFYWKGKTESEISKRLGVSRSTVRTAKKRALTKIRNILTD